MSKLQIEQSTIEKVVNYLAQQKYVEVVQILGELQEQVRPQIEQKPAEEKK